jgi:hypothetical protein
MKSSISIYIPNISINDNTIPVAAIIVFLFAHLQASNLVLTILFLPKQYMLLLHQDGILKLPTPFPVSRTLLYHILLLGCLCSLDTNYLVIAPIPR